MYCLLRSLAVLTILIPINVYGTDSRDDCFVRFWTGKSASGTRYPLSADNTVGSGYGIGQYYGDALGDLNNQCSSLKIFVRAGSICQLWLYDDDDLSEQILVLIGNYYDGDSVYYIYKWNIVVYENTISSFILNRLYQSISDVPYVTDLNEDDGDCYVGFWEDYSGGGTSWGWFVMGAYRLDAISSFTDVISSYIIRVKAGAVCQLFLYDLGGFGADPMVNRLVDNSDGDSVKIVNTNLDSSANDKMSAFRLNRVFYTEDDITFESIPGGPSIVDNNGEDNWKEPLEGPISNYNYKPIPNNDNKPMIFAFDLSISSLMVLFMFVLLIILSIMGLISCTYSLLKRQNHENIKYKTVKFDSQSDIE